MKLVSDASNWWKWHSTYIFGVLAVFPVVWLESADLQALLPATLVSKIAPVVAVIGFVVRLRAQAIKVPLPKPTVPPSNDFHQGES
jgi:hypothetical protein